MFAGFLDNIPSEIPKILTWSEAKHVLADIDYFLTSMVIYKDLVDAF